MSTNIQAQATTIAQSMQHKPVSLGLAARCQSPSEGLRTNDSNDNQAGKK
jgi:hypothetical protein